MVSISHEILLYIYPPHWPLNYFLFLFLVLLLIRSKTIQIRALKCLLLNGIIFLGSIFFFDYFIVPITRRLTFSLNDTISTKTPLILEGVFWFTYNVKSYLFIFSFSLSFFFCLNSIRLRISDSICKPYLCIKASID